MVVIRLTNDDLVRRDEVRVVRGLSYAFILGVESFRAINSRIRFVAETFSPNPTRTVDPISDER